MFSCLAAWNWLSFCKKKDLRLTGLFVGCHIIIKAIILKCLCKEAEDVKTTKSVKKGTFQTVPSYETEKKFVIFVSQKILSFVCLSVTLNCLQRKVLRSTNPGHLLLLPPAVIQNFYWHHYIKLVEGEIQWWKSDLGWKAKRLCLYWSDLPAKYLSVGKVKMKIITEATHSI